MKSLVLARAGRLVVALTVGGGESGELRGEICYLLRGGSGGSVRALALIYGGVTLFYEGSEGPVLISRALPNVSVDVVKADDCVAPAYDVEGMLEEWARLMAGDAGALERLGACTLEPRGLRIVVGRGEPLPPTGIVLD